MKCSGAASAGQSKNLERPTIFALAKMSNPNLCWCECACNIQLDEGACVTGKTKTRDEL